jgi:hypothetical protein
MKFSTIVILLATLIFSNSHAQVLNSGFELDLPQSGGIRNWTNITLFTFPSDSIFIDGALYFRNSDPHSGDHALELRNGFSTDKTYSGYVQLTDNDSDYAGFARGQDFTEAPKYFTFFYKYFPASTTDTARATILLMNAADGNIRGTAEILISKAATTYTEAVVPITYEGSGTPTTLFIEFANKTATSTPTFGTRFLVDDIGFRNTVSSVDEPSEKTQRIRCAVDKTSGSVLFESRNDGADILDLSLYTVDGRQLVHQSFTSSLRLPLNGYADGMFFYTITPSKQQAVSGKFIK